MISALKGALSGSLESVILGLMKSTTQYDASEIRGSIKVRKWFISGALPPPAGLFWELQPVAIYSVCPVFDGFGFFFRGWEQMKKL